MNITIKVWRQANATSKGHFEILPLENISSEASFLEMLDIANERLLKEKKDPIAFDHDCREGICGMCGAVVNGYAHGHEPATTLCQLHMRKFKDGETIVIEPWRSAAFPVVKDLVVDRSAFDAIIAAAGYISANTGNAQDANAIPVSKSAADTSMDAAACIGCGACVAACPNGSAMLFTAAKATHLGVLPQGKVERLERAQHLVTSMETNGFGACSNHGECEAACPKEIKLSTIARLNRDYIQASLTK